MVENYFGLTDTGKVRGNNEDTFFAETVLDDKYIAAGVIDGVGGYNGGEVAAKLAREAILQHLGEQKADAITAMKDGLTAANESIFRERQLNKDNEQMACVVTLAMVDLNANKFYYAHVGDTRLYLFRDNTLVKISHDNSFVGFLEDSGRLTEEEAMSHPKRNEINKALGFDGAIDPADYFETGESPFLPGDIILLCSDGLTDMINRSAISAILNSNKNVADKVKMLVNQANEAGGKDNITAVLVHNNKPVIKQTATKPLVANVQSGNLIKDEMLDTKYVATRDVPVVEKKKSSGAVPLLSVLLILLLGACSWLLYQYYQNKQENKLQVLETVPQLKVRNDREQKIIDGINNPSSAEVFILNVAGDNPIIITDSIVIDKERLHIIGNGATLVSDTALNGPAFFTTANSKYILLDSLTLENFDIGLIIQNNSVHFKNVMFKNCRIPLQYNMMFPANAPVSGTLFENSLNKGDTLSKQSIQ